MRTRNPYPLAALLAVAWAAPAPSADTPWPPPLPGAKGGTVALKSDLFLAVPADVEAARKKDGSAPFTVAKTAPTVEFAYHDKLGADPVSRRLWSSWGDIGVARDGRVYCGIGDHGRDAEGDARCFIYRWDPARKVLEQVADMGQVVPHVDGQPAWSKVHAGIDEGADGGIYFSCTLNDGNRADKPQYHWNEKLPGGQLYRFDPKTGVTAVHASLPPKRCTATSVMDRTRNVWWCNLESGGGNALWGIDLATKKPVFQSPDGTVGFDRTFALGRDGAVYFNGADALRKFDPKSKAIVALKAAFPGSPGMRSAGGETADGIIYGTTQKANELFRYSTKTDEVKRLGPTWLTGEYTTVVVPSPDGRFLYYLPGAHGRAWKYGTPVIQYEIATGTRKALAFLAAAFEKECGYVPGGTYGVKLSADGGTLFVNFNGHAADRARPANMKPIGFGLCGFMAIHIPASER